MTKRGWIIAATITLIVVVVGLFTTYTISLGFILGALISLLLYWRNVQFVDFVIATAKGSKVQAFMRSILSILLMAVAMILAVKFPNVLNIYALTCGLILIKVSLIAQEIGRK